MARAAHSIERRGGGGSRGPAGRIVPLLASAALCGWLLAGCGSGGGPGGKRIGGLRVVDVHQYGVYVEAGGGGGQMYVGRSPAGQAELRIGDWFTIVESPERVVNYQLMLIDGDVARFKQQTRIDRRAQREGIQIQHDVIEVRSYEPESESPATSE